MVWAESGGFLPAVTSKKVVTYNQLIQKEFIF